MSICPKCEDHNTICKDSRRTIYRNHPATRRRRHCLNCDIRYTTFELTEASIEAEFFKTATLTQAKIDKINELMRQVYDTIKE